MRFNAAVSLDGYIARTDGTYDWIIMDPTIDFSALFSEFDTLVMGRKTYEVLLAEPSGGPAEPMKKYVVSATLRQEEHPNVTVISHNVIETVAALKVMPGKDIWLFGGGMLFRYLLDANLVDTLELAVMPILLSEGIPLLPAGTPSPVLHTESSRALPSGIVMLKFGIRS